MSFKLHTFSLGIKRARKAKHLTQQQLADVINMSIDTVRNWEQGRSIPEFSTVSQLCDLLDCSMDYLFGWTDCTTPDDQAIQGRTGLSQQAIARLSAMVSSCEDSAKLDVVNHLLASGTLLDKLTSYYASALSDHIKDDSYKLIPVNPARLDPRLFSADVFDALPLARREFCTDADDDVVGDMVMHLLRNTIPAVDMIGMCDLVFSNMGKPDDAQIEAIKRLLRSAGYSDLLRRAGCDIE